MIESPARPALDTPLPRTGRPRLIAVMPAYNEAKTIAGVLERLYPLVDRLLIVDDGSVDDTRQVVFDWLEDKPHAQLISFNKNRGMSAAYYEAFQHLSRMLELGQIDERDVVVTVDADGQHDPASLDDLVLKIEDGADCVIGRRNFRLYPLYKRAGNWIMSAWASIWGGRRFTDVESGYRAFRVGALVDALRYYKGYKYSETVEIAIILPILGYTIHDTTVVDIPVFRSNTRLKDVIIDLIAMPCAWWRVMAARRLPHGVPTWFAYCVLPLFFLAATIGALRILSRSIYLADDTINNYAHVWYISDHLFGSGQVPLRFAELDGGRAFTFPYGLTPWFVNALIYPAFGDWSVTLFLVLGGVAAICGALLVRPQMRDPWLLLIFVANPFFIDAVANGQYSFVWAAAGFFVFVWSVEHRRWPLALVAVWFTVSTHPIEGGLAAAAYVAWTLVVSPDVRKPLAIVSAVALPLLAPSLYFSLGTPALGESSTSTVVISILQDLPRRGTVLAGPFALAFGAGLLRQHYRSMGAAFAGVAVFGIAAGGGLLGNVPGLGALEQQGGYYGMASAASNPYRAYLTSEDFHPGMTFRILSPNDREQGAYYVIRKHGVLANELFSESQIRRSWDMPRYQCYLAAKHVDRVVVESGYRQQFHTNEQPMLDSLVSQGEATVTYGGPGDQITVYNITPFRSAIATPASVKECRGL